MTLIRRGLGSLWGWIAVCVFCIAASDPSPAAATEITVRARSFVDLAPWVEGMQVSLNGTLRDNINQGMADQTLTLSLYRVGEGEPEDAPGGPLELVIRRERTTDRNGQFQLVDVFDESTYLVVAEFAGDDLHGPSATSRELIIQRSELRLAVSAPLAAPLSAALPISVQALDSQGEGAEVTVGLTINGQRAPSELVTNAEGLAETQLTWVAERGRATIEAAFAGNHLYIPITASTNLVIYESAQLTLAVTVETISDTRVLAIRGVLTSDVGPLVGVPVRVLQSERQPQQILTREGGRFELLGSLDGYTLGEPYSLLAQFDPLGDGNAQYRVEASARFQVDAGPLAPLSRWARPALALMLAGSVVVLLLLRLRHHWSARRNRRPRVAPPGSTAPAQRVEFSEPPPSIPRAHNRFAGRLRDADTKKPLQLGQVTVIKGESDEPWELPVATDGCFASPALEPGHYRVTLSSPGFVAHRLELNVPHTGKYAFMEVYLTSVRAWVRFLYRQLTAELELSERPAGPWGWSTPRQIEDLMRKVYQQLEGGARTASGREAFDRAMRQLSAQTDAEDGLLAAVTLLVEEIYYSPRLHDEDMVRLCETLTKAVREAALASPPHIEEERL